VRRLVPKLEPKRPQLVRGQVLRQGLEQQRVLVRGQVLLLSYRRQPRQQQR
jgi:hypothetical protein